MARGRRDRTEVSCVIKYLVFGFNVIFWILGGLICAAGLWAWSEKDMFSNIGKVTQIPFDPALFLIIGGAIVFLIGFTGCVGALRENTVLLLIAVLQFQKEICWTLIAIATFIYTCTRLKIKADVYLCGTGAAISCGSGFYMLKCVKRVASDMYYCVCVGIVLFGELAVGIVCFVYKDWYCICVGLILFLELAAGIIIFAYQDWFSTSVGVVFFVQLGFGIFLFMQRQWVKDQVQEQLKIMIRQYRDDSDLQNLIDWVQENWLHCCGVETFDDWDANIYFNCTSPSREKCGVPYSCCLPDDKQAIRNYQCGYDARNPFIVDNPQKLIYTKGCIEAGEDWFNSNLIPIAGVAVGVALVQILGICFAQNLRSDIFAQMDKWRNSHQ